MKQSVKNITRMAASEIGRQVIEREVEGLNALKTVLGTTFDAVVERILNTRGRLIISGMGKSGHVARKIAATFASTGTPAHFVHPGEASHGDLGMITENDVLLLLSNSGETEELRDMISYAKRFSIPMVAMVRRKTSMLVTAADEALVLPDIPEASPVNAPTTSTTMMMALGDALAVAVLEGRGFTREDFNVYHPGGKLGKAFIRVENLMHSREDTPVVDKDMPMSKVLIMMTEKSFGCAGVVDEDGKLVGIITDGDLRRHMSPELLFQHAIDVMSENPLTITPKMLAAEALRTMNVNQKSKSVTSLFVVNEAGKPVGILSVHDCLRAGVI
ncbi:MAG TPA: KpsF/GutQ family sugar-phosphate isomerase [Rickettsiales bacterium]|nr:KpsF/GutQ family sugar-phosphate isomerase [Rickettsiales bacterium]